MSDPLLASLVLVAQYYHLKADAPSLAREFDPEGEGFDATAAVRAARKLGFHSKPGRLNFRRARQWSLPALVQQRSGGWAVLAAYGTKPGSQSEVGVLQAPVAAPVELSLDELEAGLTGVAVLLSPRESEAARRRFDLSWFMPMVVKYRGQIGEILLATLFINLLMLALPVTMQVVFDKVLVHGSKETLRVLLVALVVITVTSVVANIFRNYIQHHLTRRMDVELGASVFRRLLSLPQAYFNARQAGVTVARLNELETIRAFLTQAVLSALLDVLFVFVYFALMYYYSVTLTLIVAATMPAYALIALFVAPVLRRRLNEQFELSARLQALSVESISSMQTLKVFGMEVRIAERWNRLKAAHAVKSFKAGQAANVGGQLITGVSQLTTALVIGFGVLEVISGAMTAGALIAFNMLSGRVAQPMVRLGQLWQEFQEAGLAVDRLGDIMNVPPEQETQATGRLGAASGKVEFRDVSYAYPGRNRPAVRDVSLALEPGRRLGIAGGSGSGKSTLAMLVVRLSSPTAGTVLVDDKDLQQVPVEWLRSHTGVVLQQNDLLTGTVRDSIAMRHPAMSDGEVIAAAELAGAHEFIVNELPNGYQTLVSERGASLSGGQRQRIALARALAGDPRILILDEATSALDYESESTIIGNLSEISKGRTMLIISHRLNVLADCDEILVMHEGQVVERGTHAQLVAMGGRYANLHRLQHKAV